LRFRYQKPAISEGDFPVAITEVRIHPAIGIARVGNSDSDFFIGPEKSDATNAVLDRVDVERRTPLGIPVWSFLHAHYDSD